MPRTSGSIASTEGKISLAEYRGRPVVVNFWGSWCDPCKEEAPVLEETWRRYKDRGLVVLGVDFHDLKGAARRFARENDMSYPLAYDGPGATITDYRWRPRRRRSSSRRTGSSSASGSSAASTSSETGVVTTTACRSCSRREILLVVVAALALAGPASAACPTLADLEGEVMCPQCKTTLDQSDAPVARDIKRFIETRADACVSESQIKDELVAQFGPAVLAAPPVRASTGWRGSCRSWGSSRAPS